MKSNKMVFLEYSFLFEPDTAWSSLSEFQSSLANFFREHGMEAQILNSVGAQQGRRILYLQRIPEPEIIVEPKKQKDNLSVGEKLRKLQPK